MPPFRYPPDTLLTFKTISSGKRQVWVSHLLLPSFYSFLLLLNKVSSYSDKLKFSLVFKVGVEFDKNVILFVILLVFNFNMQDESVRSEVSISITKD